ncbi:tetratricopeptide repeat protein [Petrimonas sp.]|jgi:tetratricopeptide (TPR) repeat protein|uniref:type IX secretion system periplasmic lipoprotein PorW/SprE n=1 Tax=Petrimonas sp. TaxID=2023866 RepID=UPI002B264150|nr:tetratricopeptide repeat protein [Petrimonas sp.]
MGKYDVKYIVVGLILSLLASGCSTRRNTPGTRAWHELNTRYNIYFNAETDYNETLESVFENYRDNYQAWLPMYPNSAVSNDTVIKMPGGPFDQVVEKMTKAIREHSITVKPRRDPSRPNTQEYRDWLRQEEYNPFIDRAWLLMGKAHLQNRDYTEAVSVLAHTVQRFAHDIDVVSEAEIWMMRAYAEMGWFAEAEILATALKLRKLPVELGERFTEFYAFLLLKQKSYREALPFLEQAIRNEKNRKQRRRLTFLVGQIYAYLGDSEHAYNAFEQLAGWDTPYEELINARIAQARLATGGRAVDALLKMAEKKRNSAFLGQIHAAIGAVHLSQNNLDKAIESFLIAEKESMGDAAEKAQIEVALGDIYFSRNAFVQAESRYSQALGKLPEQHESYLRVKFRADLLGELVPHLAAVAVWDSIRQQPVTQEIREMAADKAEAALFRIGDIAAGRLGNIDYAVEAYSRLLSEFPESTRRREIYSRLLLIFLMRGDQEMARNFKEKIVSEFPESEYALAMEDPDYDYVIRNYAKVQDSLYQDTYLAYREGRTETVQRNFERAKRLFFNGHLMPKFTLLSALSRGQSGDLEESTALLQELAQKQPESGEGAYARQIVTGLSEGRAMVATALPFTEIEQRPSPVMINSQADSVYFDSNKDLTHSLLLLSPSIPSRRDELLFAVSDFNFSNFQVRTFRSDFTSLPPYDALQVKPFQSFAEAGRYLAMLAADTVFRQNITAGIVPLIISDQNLAALQSGKPLAAYLDFFRDQLDDLPGDSLGSIEPISVEWKSVETEKNVPLNPVTTDLRDSDERLSAEQLRAVLEAKEKEALGQVDKRVSKGERERLLKERERLRKKEIKEREKELKLRLKAREEALKQLERERRQKLKMEERLRKEKQLERERILKQQKRK